MARRYLTVTDPSIFEKTLEANQNVVVHFGAPWCEPCRQLDSVLTILAQSHEAAFIRVEAEEATDLSIKFEVSVVPLVVFLKTRKEVDRLEGADIAALTEKFFDTSAGEQLATDRKMSMVDELIHRQPVMLLMKGTPDQPRCGFSSRVVQILRNLNIAFGHFDILSDEGIRQAAKVFSDWPSYPQLYIRGEFIGGCDIVQEMADNGELKQQLHGLSSQPSSVLNMEERLHTLTTASDVMLFMKGSPEAPQCGFSAKVVQALRSQDIAFKTFDILQDQDVREGLKKFSQWPTYPQVYAGGELLGGCDIVLEYLKEGTLKKEIETQIASQKS